MHAQAQLDVPAEGVHRVLVQDGQHISVMDGTVSTTVAPEETTAKVISEILYDFIYVTRLIFGLFILV